jgi:acyl carrier protein
MDRKQEIFETMKQHLEGRGVEAELITPDAHLARDLGLDSLDTVELTLGLEEKYGIEIPDTELEDLETVSDAVALIDGQVGASV